MQWSYSKRHIYHYRGTWWSGIWSQFMCKKTKKKKENIKMVSQWLCHNGNSYNVFTSLRVLLHCAFTIIRFGDFFCQMKDFEQWFWDLLWYLDNCRLHARGARIIRGSNQNSTDQRTQSEEKGHKWVRPCNYCFQLTPEQNNFGPA